MVEACCCLIVLRLRGLLSDCAAAERAAAERAAAERAAATKWELSARERAIVEYLNSHEI